jgi:hypothetical protein
MSNRFAIPGKSLVTTPNNTYNVTDQKGNLRNRLWNEFKPRELPGKRMQADPEHETDSRGNWKLLKKRKFSTYGDNGSKGLNHGKTNEQITRGRDIIIPLERPISNNNKMISNKHFQSLPHTNLVGGYSFHNEDLIFSFSNEWLEPLKGTSELNENYSMTLFNLNTFLRTQNNITADSIKNCIRLDSILLGNLNSHFDAVVVPQSVQMANGYGSKFCSTSVLNKGVGDVVNVWGSYCHIVPNSDDTENKYNAKAMIQPGCHLYLLVLNTYDVTDNRNFMQIYPYASQGMTPPIHLLDTTINGGKLTHNTSGTIMYVGVVISCAHANITNSRDTSNIYTSGLKVGHNVNPVLKRKQCGSLRIKFWNGLNNLICSSF